MIIILIIILIFRDSLYSSRLKTIEGFQITGPRNEAQIPGPAGPRGPPGPVGPTGPIGPIGPTGPVGPQGPRGFPGMDGKSITGPMGPQGPAGQNGQMGPAGPAGQNGQDGRTGPMGPRGPRGYKGPRGQRGQMGPPGTIGSNSCKLFGSDQINNGWSCPDDYPVYTGASFGSTNKLQCTGGLAKNASCTANYGYGATGSVIIENGRIIGVLITNNGHNYKNPPHVRIIGNGTGAVLSAEVSNGQVQRVNIINPGNNYQQAGIIFDPSDSGYGAELSAVINEGTGQIEKVNILNSGQNYTVTPTIQLIGDGYGAKLKVKLSNGRITEVVVLNGGNSYTYNPSITVIPGKVVNACQYCHMCCKKNSVSELEYNKYEDLNNKIDSLANKLDTQQHEMFELSRNANRSVITNSYSLQESKPSRPIQKASVISQEEINQLMIRVDQIGTHANLNTTKLEQMNLNTNTSIQPVQSAKPIQVLPSEDNLRLNTDITKMAVISQSSTMDNNIPEHAIDGNLRTYSETTITNQPSWFRLTYNQDMEFNEIDIRNRLGNNIIQERLVPFYLNIYNSNEVLVGSNYYTNVSSEYKWSNIDLVGRVVEIKQVKPNYLHIAEIKVYGKPALSCQAYQDNFNIIDSAYKTATISSTGLTSDLKNQHTRAMKLNESCAKLSSEDTNLRTGLIQARAEAYDQILTTNLNQLNQKKEKAKKLYQKVLAEQKAEQVTAETAAKLGLPGPPPRYTQAQIDIIKKTMNMQPRTFTDEQKANCMTMLQTAMTLKQKAHDTGIQVASMPELKAQAKEQAKQANKAWDLYKSTCSLVNPGSQ